MEFIGVLALIAPLFAIIALGWLARWRNTIGEEGMAGVNGFTYAFALPSLLFVSVAGLAVPRMDVAGMYLVCCILVFAAAILVGHILLGNSLSRNTMFGLNATYGSVIFLGVPLVSTFFGQEGVTLILAIIALHSGVLLPLAALLVELDGSRGRGARAVWRDTLRRLPRNPILMAILLGFAWRATGIPLLEPLRHALSLLGQSATPLALFCAGASLPAMAPGTRVMREAAFTAALKLVLLPVCVGLGSSLMGLTGVPWRVAVLTSALPTGVNAFMLARQSDSFVETSASTVVLGMAMSMVSLTSLIVYLR